MSVAATILAQLGGYRFASLVKLYDRKDGSDRLAFSFKGSDKANRCQVILDWSDTYTMTFYNGAEVIEEYDDVYCDQLQDIFSSVTGINLDTVRVRFE